MATNNRIPNRTLEGVPVRFRNFSGKEAKFNAEGQRNFAVFLDPDTATEMIEEGWNIKQLPPREEGDVPQDYIKVKVSYKEGQREPAITLISNMGKKRTSLHEDGIDILDWADIKQFDVIISPYYWTVNGESGITAYLHRAFVTINEDELELKYADLEDGPVSAQAAIDGGPRFEGEDNYNE